MVGSRQARAGQRAERPQQRRLVSDRPGVDHGDQATDLVEVAEVEAARVKVAEAVAAAAQGVDAVLSAYNPGWGHPELFDEFLRGSAAITAGVKQAGVARLLAVGGAGSLYVAPGVQL